MGMLSEPVARRLLGAQFKSSSNEAVSRNESAADEHAEKVKRQSHAWTLVYWVEVPLRNVIHSELIDKFGPNWWNSREFQLTVGTTIASEALKSKRANTRSKPFLDDLSLGFWVRFLSPQLEQRVWVPVLRFAFANGVSRKQLHNDLLKFKNHRNSLAHHELRNAVQLAEMRALALRIAACIDEELFSLIETL